MNRTVSFNTTVMSLKDSSYFFPVGVYESCRSSDAASLNRLKEIADCGFNCVLNYTLYKGSVQDINTYLNLADKLGIKVIFSLKDIYTDLNHELENTQINNWKGEEAIFKGFISTFHSHPSILAWYLNDEIPLAQHDKLIQHYTWLKELDTIHPGYIVIDRPKLAINYGSTTDILGVDPYPIPYQPIDQVAQWTDLAYKSGKPVWAVIQIFDWASYKSVASAPPTLEEIKCMTYLALTHGANGLIFFSYYKIKERPNFSENWKNLKQVIKELNQIARWLITAQSDSVHIENNLHVRTWQKGLETLIIAVNSERKPIKYKINISDNINTVKYFSDSRKIQVNNGSFQDDFKPLAVHIYLATP